MTQQDAQALAGQNPVGVGGERDKKQEVVKRSSLDSWTLAIAVIVLAGLFVSAGTFMFKIITSDPKIWEEVLKTHIGAIIVLQVAAAVSFALVVFLRQTDGPIKFKVLGFEFDGASGQVVMWIACFLAIAAAIKMCWSA